MKSMYAYNLGLLFYQVSSEFSDNTAIVFPSGEEVTFRQLNLQSNRVANFLLHHHVQKGDVICIFNNKSFNAFASMIACLKIGAIYTNIDITSPWQRIEKMLKTCHPKVILNDQMDLPVINEIKRNSNTFIINIHTNEFNEIIANESSENLYISATVTGDHPAYLMFTSGSTGVPKGAIMTHGNVINFISWGQTTFSVTEKDVFTNVNPIYFDNSVFDFYVSLFSGASLVPITSDITKVPQHLVKTINSLGCTIWFSVPSMLVYLIITKTLTTTDFSSLRFIIFGGEGFPKPKLKILYDLFAFRTQLINVYGPTECTCICSSYKISGKDFENMNELAPLGHIAPNFNYEILPIDASNPNYGELGLLGPNIGLGYYNEEEHTAKSFVIIFRKKMLQRMYRTGDLVELRPDGYLYFKGRTDNQIKHMGFRIELEEIESAINSLPYIHETGVIYKKATNNLSQIIAFVSTTALKKENEIISGIKNLLPPYMIPKKIITLDTLPKNQNGKIDRIKLTKYLT